MKSDWNVIAVWKCRTNIIDSDSEDLKFDNEVEKGSFIQLVENKLGIVIYVWKDSKVLQKVSTVMKSGCKEV